MQRHDLEQVKGAYGVDDVPNWFSSRRVLNLEPLGIRYDKVTPTLTSPYRRARAWTAWKHTM